MQIDLYLTVNLKSYMSVFEWPYIKHEVQIKCYLTIITLYLKRVAGPLASQGFVAKYPLLLTKSNEVN